MNQSEQQVPDGPPRTSGMAIAALVLGILGLCTIVTAVPGLILGIVAMIQISKDPYRLKGQGMAIAGTILSGFSVLLIPVMAAILFPVFARAREAAQQTNCMNSVKRINTALMMYQSDWDSAYPLAENWNEALAKYVKSSDGASMSKAPWVCPTVKDSDDPTYAFNSLLSGKREGDVVLYADTVSIFESAPGKNKAGGAELLPSPSRHRDSNTVGFADGHVKPVYDTERDSLNFDPAATKLPGEPEDGCEDDASGG